jgi:hypothetical protein
MSNEEAVETEQIAVAPSTFQQYVVEIPDAPPVRLQTLDLARHIAVAPDGRRYVVATFDDNHMGNGYHTAVYPQQNGYLTLVRLPVYESSAETPEQAVQRHISLVQLIQQGKLKEILKSNE